MQKLLGTQPQISPQEQWPTLTDYILMMVTQQSWMPGGTVCSLSAGSPFIPEQNIPAFFPRMCCFCSETPLHCYLSGIIYISASHILCICESLADFTKNANSD